MIIGSNTNTVYFSERLLTEKRFTSTCNQLTAILDRHRMDYGFLKGTKDIWCRDYMPIQKGTNEFIQFRYEPSYLKADLDLQSDPKVVCEANNINARFSDINLDGGNVVNWSDRVVMTDRIFDENPAYTDKSKLISALENLFQAEIIIIPQIKSDYTGHADGLVRFVDRNTLLGNHRDHEYKYWKSGIDRVLHSYGIDYIDIPFLDHKEKNHPEHAIGCYVNYLEVNDIIVLPIFEVPRNKDSEVVDLFKQIFPDRKIETINYNAVGIFGGLLNCTTWTIFQ